MDIRYVSLPLCAFFLVYFLIGFTFKTFAEINSEEFTVGRIMDQLYIGSITIEQDPKTKPEKKERNSTEIVSINQTREITVGGASLAACQAALMDLIKTNRNVESTSECKAKDRESSAI